MGTLSVIANQNKITRNQRDASLRSAHSTLPSILAELSRRCNHNTIVILLNSQNALTNDSKLPKHLEKYIDAEILPFISGHEFQILKDCIEFADERDAYILSRIVSDYQILYSRCEDRDFPSILQDLDIEGRVPSSIEKAFDWQLLHCVISHCFQYARTFSRDKNIPTHMQTCHLASRPYITRQSCATRIPWVISQYDTVATNLMEELRNKDGTDKSEVDVTYFLQSP